jgi:hypothetical protein
MRMARNPDASANDRVLGIAPVRVQKPRANRRAERGSDIFPGLIVALETV